MALQLNPGDRYESFEILSVVRKYDASWVYRCKAEGYDHEVAVRISLDPVRDQESARRAMREITVLEELTNNHVTRVFGSGMGADDHWYIVLEALEGARLDHWHDFDRPMGIAQAAGLIHQACLGLAEVHNRGVVHRDLKPGNLWVEPDGNLKIIDFASARGFGEHALAGDNVTTQHVLVGTPQYAPPEQAYSSTLSPAADIYSLAVILYELLTGHSPFFPDRSRSDVVRTHADDPVAWMGVHARETPTPLNQHAACKDAPEDLVALLDACLAKRPEDRPQNAGALANSLGWILHHVLGQAPVVTMRVSDPQGAVAYRMVPPGSHRVGFGLGLDLRLRLDGDDEVWGLIEWAGPPKPAEFRAVEGRPVTVNGASVAARCAIQPGDVLSLGGFTLQLSYPQA
ncbi:serine/threonine protein kinase [Pseudenhygromyxa sp. WMMC2535]|uniref:serine/threonine protein kinase n=1 Tax=Pseudenhygromyxa sp. WMMC2535 TaxID=2712867 RepID=UPI0015544346|nr:serine/threonine-protein kinase [Pseudenhygromyxa sp. WMMC2535]NVB42000.1 serine/threonine protein kinase [Pseudenhygromyxa sp. WMMC2535]